MSRLYPIFPTRPTAHPQPWTPKFVWIGDLWYIGPEARLAQIGAGRWGHRSLSARTVAEVIGKRGEAMGAEGLVESGIHIVVILGSVVLGSVCVRLVRQRVLQGAQASDRLNSERKGQIQTVAQVVAWIANVLIAGIGTVTVLGYFVDITPLLTGLGVAGLALSLGAQTLVKDLIGGLMILVENQYVVGDVIRIGDVSGVVERLTLRATYVRDIKGDLHLIPNGDVRVVSNGTRGWSRALVDLGVAYEEDMSRVLAVLEREAEQFALDTQFAAHLLEPPTVTGPLALGDWAVTVRVMVKTHPGKQWAVATELRRRLLAACERENIALPYPRQEVLVSSQKEKPSSVW